MQMMTGTLENKSFLFSTINERVEELKVMPNFCY